MHQRHIQTNNLSARLDDLRAELVELSARLDWVLSTFGESRWAEGLFQQAVRLESKMSEVESRLARL